MNMLTLTPKKNGVAGGTAKEAAVLSAISSAPSETIVIRWNEIIITKTSEARENNKNHQPYGTAATDTSKPHGVYLTQGVGAVCRGLAS